MGIVGCTTETFVVLDCGLVEGRHKNNICVLSKVLYSCKELLDANWKVCSLQKELLDAKLKRLKSSKIIAGCKTETFGVFNMRKER